MFLRRFVAKRGCAVSYAWLMMHQVNVHAAKTQLSKLIEQACLYARVGR